MSSSFSASRLPLTRWPSTRRAGWSLRLPLSFRRAARSRARLSSMLMIASQSSLTTAPPGKCLGDFAQLVVQLSIVILSQADDHGFDVGVCVAGGVHDA